MSTRATPLGFWQVATGAHLIMTGGGCITMMGQAAEEVTQTVADVRLDQTPFSEISPSVRTITQIGMVNWDNGRVRNDASGSAAFRRGGYLRVSPGGQSLVLDGPFRIEAWVWIAHRTDATFHGTAFVLNTHSNGLMVNYVNSDNKDSAVWINGDVVVYRTGADAWPRDRWIQFLITRNSSNRLVVTVDGVSNLDVVYPGIINTNPNATLYVGASPHNLGELLNGNVAALTVNRR